MPKKNNRTLSGRRPGFQPAPLAILLSLSFCQPNCSVSAQENITETPPFNSQLIESQESERLLSSVELAQWFTPAGFSWEAAPNLAHPIVIVVAPGSEAEKAGIKEGSILLEIDGVDTRFLGYHSLFDLLLEHRGIPCPIILKENPYSTPQTVKLLVPDGERFKNRVNAQRTENKNAKKLDSIKLFDVPYALAYETISTPLLLEFTDSKEKSKHISAEIFAEVIDTETGKKFSSIGHRVESIGSPLANYFQVQDVPTYVFILSQFSQLSEGEDIFRTELSEEDLVNRLNRLRVDWYIRKTGAGKCLGIQEPMRTPRRSK